MAKPASWYAKRYLDPAFVMLHGDKALWFELMRGGVEMPQLEVHDKQSAGAEIKPRVRTD